MIFIVAGNRQQAEEYARESRLPKSGFVIIDEDSVRGFSRQKKDSLVMVGTWRQHRDYRNLLMVLIPMGFSPEEIR